MKRRALLSAVLTLVGAWTGGVCATDLAIVHARVVSPPTVIEDATVLITGDRIDYVGNHPASFTAATVIDAQGKTLIPGLIDTHAHLIIGPRSDTEYAQAITSVGAVKLREYLQLGFTTVMSVGDYWPQILRVRKSLREGTLLGPQLLIVGPLITATGGHPTDVEPECLSNPYCRAHWAGQVDTIPAARQLVEALAAARVDAIKVTYTPTSDSGGLKVMGLPAPIVKAVIEQAHAKGLPVAVYAEPVGNGLDAIRWGANWLTHPLYDGVQGLTADGKAIPTANYATLVKEAQKHHTAISTTVADAAPVDDYWGVRRMAHTGDDYINNRYGIDLAMGYRKLKADMRYLTDQGVPVAFGLSKFRLPIHISVPLEFKALQEAGFTRMQVLQIATVNAAHAIGRAQDLGSIDAGKRADLVLLSKDPLLDDDALNHVEWVMKAGALVYRHGCTDP